MVNCVGYCDNFLSNGQSSVWNHKGKLLKHLGKEKQALLMYDTESEEVVIASVEP